MSFRFPPHGGGGVQRNVYFVKYLPEFGWKPHVLTGPGELHGLKDESLLRLVPPEVPVARTEALDLERWFDRLARFRLSGIAKLCTLSLPAVDPGWIPYAVARGREIVEDERVDVIYSSSYPISSHLVAGWLKKRTGLPWVADYRDEWSLRRILTWRTPLHRWLAETLDRRIVRTADRVVTTSPAHTRRFREVFGGDEEKFRTVTNGFEPSDFEGPRPRRPEELRGCFLVAHVGSVFEWRGVTPFLAALRRVVGSKGIPPGAIRAVFVGNVRTDLPEDLREAGIVKATGYVSHAEAVAWMRRSDTLLLVNTEHTNIPGKTFEYLAAGKPILSLVREGPTADLVRRAEAGPVVAPENVDEIAETLRTLYDAWARGGPGPSPRPDVVARYSRRRTAQRLSRVLSEARDRISASSPAKSTHPQGKL